MRNVLRSVTRAESVSRKARRAETHHLSAASGAPRRWCIYTRRAEFCAQDRARVESRRERVISAWVRRRDGFLASRIRPRNRASPAAFVGCVFVRSRVFTRMCVRYSFQRSTACFIGSSRRWSSAPRAPESTFGSRSVAMSSPFEQFPNVVPQPALAFRVFDVLDARVRPNRSCKSAILDCSSVLREVESAWPGAQALRRFTLPHLQLISLGLKTSCKLIFCASGAFSASLALACAAARAHMMDPFPPRRSSRSVTFATRLLAGFDNQKLFTKGVRRGLGVVRSLIRGVGASLIKCRPILRLREFLL